MHMVAHVRAWIAYRKEQERLLHHPGVEAINRAIRSLNLGGYVPKERFEILELEGQKEESPAITTLGLPPERAEGHLLDEEPTPISAIRRGGDDVTGIASLRYSRPGKGISFYWLKANGEVSLVRHKQVGQLIQRVNGRLTIRYGSTVTPIIEADKVLQSAEKKEKLWEKEKELKDEIHRLHHLLSRTNISTTAGLAKANRLADAIEILAAELKDSDYVLRTIASCDSHSFRLRRKPDGKTAFYPPEEVNGRRIWTPIIDITPRYAPHWQGATGSRWETITGRFATYSRLVTFPILVAAGRCNLGEAELGLEDEFVPLKEPADGQRLPVILRSPGENAMELPDDGDTTFNVVNEERVDRRFTYNPEAEEERLADFLERLDDCRTPDDFVLLHDEVEIAWKAKAFRWHIFREAMNAVIEAAQEAIPPSGKLEHAVLQRAEELHGKKSPQWLNIKKMIVQMDDIHRWVGVGASDAIAPNHTAALRTKLQQLKNERVREIRPRLKNAPEPEKGKFRNLLRRNLNEARAVRAAISRFEKKNGRAMQWSWENFLAREGLGTGFDGQPFSDTSEDALGRKDARGGDMETMENLANDETSFIEELLELDGVGEKTILALEEAGYATVEQVNEATFEELYEVIGNKRRALLVWWGGAGLVADRPSTLRDLRYVATSLFGRTRGLSVDLLRPFHRSEENIRVQIERDLSESPHITQEEANQALKIQSWLRAEAWDHLPGSEYTGRTEFVPNEDFVSRCLFLGRDE